MNNFQNGFEVDTAGWFGYSGSTIVRQASGTTGDVYAPAVAASAGSYLARLNVGTCTNDTFGGGIATDCAGPYTDWGLAITPPFPAAGYVTKVDVYLDATYAAAHPPCGNQCIGTRFDWDSATSVRDYVFNVGTSPGASFTSCPAGFVVATGFNAMRTGADPYSNTNHICIATSGWYTFQHSFSDVAGVVVANLTVTPAGGSTPAGQWTLSSGDLTATTGCANYGWFAAQEMPGLAIDESAMAGCPNTIPDPTTSTTSTSSSSSTTTSTSTTTETTTSTSSSSTTPTETSSTSSSSTTISTTPSTTSTSGTSTTPTTTTGTEIPVFPSSTALLLGGAGAVLGSIFMLRRRL